MVHEKPIFLFTPGFQELIKARFRVNLHSLTHSLHGSLGHLKTHDRSRKIPPVTSATSIHSMGSISCILISSIRHLFQVFLLVCGQSFVLGIFSSGHGLLPFLPCVYSCPLHSPCFCYLAYIWLLCYFPNFPVMPNSGSMTRNNN